MNAKLIPERQLSTPQNAIEPMQVDAQPEDVENNEEDNYIVENSTLDLEAYANSYEGLARCFRLIYIAEHCPSLRVDALKMAIAHVMTTLNTTIYQQLHKKLADLHPPPPPVTASVAGGGGAAAAAVVPGVSAAAAAALPDVTGGVQRNGNGNIGAGAGAAAPVAGVSMPLPSDLPVFDAKWVETKSKSAALILEKLDNDLKTYKGNSIKESVRRGQDDLGNHYLHCGDLPMALKSYSRARDYCTSGKHVVSMCMNVIKVSIYLRNWAHVLSYVSKAEGNPDYEPPPKSNQDPGLASSLKCAAGLADLATKKYKSAAKHFLAVNFDYCVYPEMLSSNNVTMYGGLCALATFDRQELQKLVIHSSSFKLFLELEPQLRDIIFKFYESKYASCLRLLDEIRDNLLLDMYIAPHVHALYTQIRNRALIQYFSPYLSADMHKMADAFNRSVPALENELMQLILDGQIQARIDSHNKILYAKDADQRSSTFEKAMNIGKEYQRRTRMLILRAAMLKAHIHVKVSGGVLLRYLSVHCD